MLVRSGGSVWPTRACVLLLLIPLLLGPPTGARAGSRGDQPVAPALALDPASGPCSTRVAVYGSGVTPGVTIHFLLTRDRDRAVTAGNSTGGGGPARSDGTYISTFPLYGCGPDEPVGSTFTIAMFEYRPDRTPSRGPVASATFTVAAPGTLPGLPNTGGGGAAAADSTRWRVALALLLAALGWVVGALRRHDATGVR